MPWFQFFYVKWNLEAMCVFQINWFSVILTTVKFYFVSVGELCQNNADILKFRFSFCAWSENSKLIITSAFIC